MENIDIYKEINKATVALTPPPYDSKSLRGECKNSDCVNQKRHGSAYCQECSDKH